MEWLQIYYMVKCPEKKTWVKVFDCVNNCGYYFDSSTKYLILECAWDESYRQLDRGYKRE